MELKVFIDNLSPSDIKYKIVGSLKDNSEVIVLIHGLQSSHITFDDIIDEIHDHGYTVLAYDQRGHGETPRSGYDYSAGIMAADLKGLMDRLGIAKASFVGHSMGGRTLMAFIDLYPEMINKAIIEDMGIHQRASNEVEHINEIIERAKKAERNSCIYSSLEELHEFLSLNTNTQEADWACREKIIALPDGRVMLRYFPDSRILYGTMANCEDMTHIMKDTNVPVLYLQAGLKGSAVLTKNCRTHIEENVDGANVLLIPESEHSIHKSHKQEFISAVTAFLKET